MVKLSKIAGKFQNWLIQFSCPIQVFVGDFTPPPPVDVPMLMEEFTYWLNSEETQNIRPIEFAALAHYKLVVIHPFYDGNGRTSRLLMNLILMKAGYPPVIIRVQDRLRYYETLEQGNNGDIRPFIRFIAENTERTLEEYLSATMENQDIFDSGISIQQGLEGDRKNRSGQRIIYIENEEN